MEKQKQQNLIKRYVSYSAICAVILLIGVILSVPIKVKVRSMSNKPPFLFALFIVILFLATAIGGAYVSYLYWFQEKKARKNLETLIDRSANWFFIFRLPIYNPTFLFWFIRAFYPILSIFLFGLFFLLLFSIF